METDLASMLQLGKQHAVAICLGTAMGLLALFAVLTRKSVNALGPPEYPLIQGLPWVFRYARKSALNAILVGCDWFEWKTWTIKWPGHPRLFFISSPENLQHVLKTNFSNYPKGEWLRSLLTDLLGKGIFVADGDEWYTQRKVSVTMFSARNFSDNIVHVFHKNVITMKQVLDNAAKTGQSIDMHHVFHRYTLDSIAEIAFGTSIGSLLDPTVAFARAFDDAQATVEHRAYLPGWQYLRYFLPREYRLRRSVRILRDYCRDLIKERKARQDFEERGDVLSRFMSMKDDDGNYIFLDDEDFLRDVVLNFMIAGRDTTAQAMSWALWRVMQHPSVLQSVRDDVAQQSVPLTEMSYDQLSKGLKYTNAVMHEALRLHPSVPKDIKQCVSDDVLPDGTVVPAGSQVVYLPHAMGRSKAIWGADADEFRPERFLAPGLKINAFAYPVFNAGPRTCLGQHMALVQSTHLMASLLKDYDFKLDERVPVEPLDSLTLPMAHGMRVFVQKRHS